MSKKLFVLSLLGLFAITSCSPFTANDKDASPSSSESQQKKDESSKETYEEKKARAEAFLAEELEVLAQNNYLLTYYYSDSNNYFFLGDKGVVTGRIQSENRYWSYGAAYVPSDNGVKIYTSRYPIYLDDEFPDFYYSGFIADARNKSEALDLIYNNFVPTLHFNGSDMEFSNETPLEYVFKNYNHSFLYTLFEIGRVSHSSERYYQDHVVVSFNKTINSATLTLFPLTIGNYDYEPMIFSISDIGTVSLPTLNRAIEDGNKYGVDENGKATDDDKYYFYNKIPTLDTYSSLCILPEYGYYEYDPYTNTRYTIVYNNMGDACDDYAAKLAEYPDNFEFSYISEEGRHFYNVYNLIERSGYYYNEETGSYEWGTYYEKTSIGYMYFRHIGPEELGSTASNNPNGIFAIDCQLYYHW